MPGIRVTRQAPTKSIGDLLSELVDPALRENALLELVKRRESFQNLAPLLWNSRGTIALLIQEIQSIYPDLSSSNLMTQEKVNRVYNAIILLQIVASHPDTKMPFLRDFTLKNLFPLLRIRNNLETTEQLKIASLCVIGALVKVEYKEALTFLVSAQSEEESVTLDEVIKLCLLTMETGNDSLKTVATFVVKQILLDDMGLNYVCENEERLFAVKDALENMITGQSSSLLLMKNILKCHLRISDHPRACYTLRTYLSEMLTTSAFSACLDDPVTSWFLEQLEQNVQRAYL